MAPIQPPTRIVSVDALRGLTIAFMILVNDPGDWAHIYPPLDHAQWNGFTPTDLVFPTFLFLIGCAIVFSLTSRIAADVPTGKLALQILRRSAILFAIKMFLSAYPRFHVLNLRLYGVLTRIALCYLLAGLLFLYVRRPRTLALIAASLLIGYWALLRFVPIPGLGHPVRDFAILDPDRNLTAWIDRGVSAFTLATVHMGRLYQKTRDPEGLLSTLPAVATVIFGILAAQLIRHKPPLGCHSRRESAFALFGPAGMLATTGLICLAAALAWNPWFPINKNLWTSSYVLFAGGWSLLLLALFYYLFDAQKIQARSSIERAILWPLQVYGSNAITAFVFSEFVVETLLWIKVPKGDGKYISVWGWTYAHVFARHGSTYNTSLAFACVYVVFCFIPNWLLWRKKIFLRI